MDLEDINTGLGEFDSEPFQESDLINYFRQHSVSAMHDQCDVELAFQADAAFDAIESK